jgi:hypothetical protein
LVVSFALMEQLFKMDVCFRCWGEGFDEDLEVVLKLFGFLRGGVRCRLLLLVSLCCGWLEWWLRVGGCVCLWFLGGGLWVCFLLVVF